MNLGRRRSLRLRFRDLAAFSAFTAVGISGAIPLPVSVLFVLAFVVSMLGRRPFAAQRAWSVIVLLATAIVLFGLAFRGAIDLVVAAVSFAALVTAHRMLSEPVPATDQQVLLASLLLIAGAAALSGELWYALCLLGFGVFACLALGLAVVEGPVERDEDLPLAPVMRQVSIGVAFALAGGIAFFVFFPRLSWNVAARRATPGVLGGTTGMSDRVRLGGGGSIKTSARVVLRARLEPDPGVERLERYWVGRRFDTFDGREWRGSGRERGRPRPRISLGELGAHDQLLQRVELLPAYESRTLVGLEQPLVFSQATALTTSGSQGSLLIEVEGEEVHFDTTANAYSYVAYSSASARLPELEGERERMLELPPQLDPRVRELADRVAGAERDPEKAARALERWLKSNLGYTLELPGDVEDPLSDFLFNRKEGHCEHFATALAVLLRTRGIPSRVTVGFFGGERGVDRYVVRAGDAHAWVEALTQDGWLTLDATPDAGRGNQPIAVMAMLSDLLERLEELWRSKVVDYSLIDQVQFVRQLVKPPRERSAEPQRDGSTRVPARAIAVAIGAALLTWFAWRLATRRLDRRPHPAASFLDELERRLEQAHIRRQPGEGIEELSHRLEAASHPLSPAVRRATRRYLEARFGHQPLARSERTSLLEPIAPPR